MNPLAVAPSRPARLDSVLAFAWDSGEFTASDAMAATGLTRSTTIEALDELVDLGLLVELPNAREVGEYSKGRPARRFSLAGDAAVLVGVDAGERHVTVRVTDLRSQPLSTLSIEVDSDTDAADVRSRLVVDAIETALEEAHRSRGDVLSLCIGVPAPVGVDGRSPRHPQSYWERTNPGFVDAVKWAPIVRIDNDASLAAVAEGSVGGAVGSDNYIALLAGDRLGAGVVVDGRLLRGTHGGVGEMVAFDNVVGVGGSNGIGTRLTRWAINARAHDEYAADAPLARLGVDELTGRTILDLAAAGDPDAVALAERAGVVLSRIVSVMAGMFDPAHFVVSGAISAGIAPVVEAARQHLPKDMHLPAPELVISPLGGDVVVLGALAAASTAARDRVLDVWVERTPVG